MAPRNPIWAQCQRMAEKPLGQTHGKAKKGTEAVRKNTEEQHKCCNEELERLVDLVDVKQKFNKKRRETR